MLQNPYDNIPQQQPSYPYQQAQPSRSGSYGNVHTPSYSPSPVSSPAIGRYGSASPHALVQSPVAAGADEEQQLMDRAINESRAASEAAAEAQRLKAEREAREELELVRAMQESQDEDLRRIRAESRAKEEEATLLRTLAESSRAAEEQRLSMQQQEDLELQRALERSQQETFHWRLANPDGYQVASTSQSQLEDLSATTGSAEMSQLFRQVVPVSPQRSPAVRDYAASEEPLDQLLFPSEEPSRPMRQSMPSSTSRSKAVFNARDYPVQRPYSYADGRQSKPLPKPPIRQTSYERKRSNTRPPLPKLPTDRPRRSSAPSIAIQHAAPLFKPSPDLPSAFEEEDDEEVDIDPFDDQFAEVNLDDASSIRSSSSRQLSSPPDVPSKSSNRIYHSTPSSPAPRQSSLPSSSPHSQALPIPISSGSPEPDWSASSLSLRDSLFSQALPSTAETDIDLTRHSDQLQEDFKGVRIGFPALLPELQPGFRFPEIVELSSFPDDTLSTFSIEAFSYRNLVEFLMFHYECSLATTPADIQALKSDQPMPCTISFEFFSALPSQHRAATIRLCIALHPDSNQPMKIVPVTPPSRMRYQLRSDIQLPITLYQLAEKLRDVHSEARQCVANDGGNMYDLGKEISQLARSRGEKSSSSRDLQRIVSVKGCRVMDRLRRIKAHAKGTAPREAERKDSVRLHDEAYYITPFKISEFG